MNSTEYVVRVHRDDDDSYWAEVVELPGCFASGESLDQLSEALAESIALYLGDDDGGAEVPPVHSPLRIGEMRVTVAA